MTPQQQKKALRLYKHYKCDTAEYRNLAESLGMLTTDLNLFCWKVLHAERVRKEQEDRVRKEQERNRS